MQRDFWFKHSIYHFLLDLTFLVIAVQDLRDIDQYEESDDWEERAHEPMDQN